MISFAKILKEAADEGKIALTTTQARGIAASFETVVTQHFKSDDCVVSLGVGRLKCADRAARSGRNPATGAVIQIPARRVIRFSAGKALKEALVKPKRGGAKKK